MKSHEARDHVQKDAFQKSIEVPVSTFDNFTATTNMSTALRRVVTKTRLLTISTSGVCTVKDEPRHMPAKETRATVHRMSLKGLYNPFPSIGKFKGSAWDKLLDCILWLKERGSDKYVNTSKDVLARYHDAFLYADVPLTIKVRATIRGGILRPVLIWLEFAAALISVIVYVHSTYETNSHEYFPIIETVCGAFFFLDYFVNLYSAPVRLYFIFSATGIVDLISILPIACVWSGQRNVGVEILLFLRALRYPPINLANFLHIFAFIGPCLNKRLLPILTSIGLTGATIAQQIFRLVAYTFGVIFIAAGVLQWVDNKATSTKVREASGCSPKGCLSFFDAFYFMIVTISTVGYGDITPRSNWGRVIAISAILIALVILPNQVNNLLQLAFRRPYGGYFAVNKVVGSRFIIVSGNLKYRTVQDFLSEFYHPNHDQGIAAFPLRVVLMAPFKPSFELKTLLTLYNERVEFLQGSPLKDSDLDRVGTRVASAFFLLADQNAQDPDAEDATQILRALAVHRHSGSRIRVIVELINPDKKTNAIWDDTDQGVEIIFPEAVRFKLLSKSCHVQGVSTFLVNLFRQGLVVSKPEKGNWLRQYYHGLKQEVFPVLLPSVFYKEELQFEEAAELVYHRLGVLLFALDIVNDLTSGRELVLFPRGRTLEATDVGMVIAKNLEAAERVSTFGMQKKKRCRHIRACCTSCRKNPGTTDLESITDIKSKRYFSGNEEEQTSEYTIAMPGGHEIESSRRTSSPTEGLLRRMSDFQTPVPSASSSLPDGKVEEVDLGQTTDGDLHPHQVSSLEEAIDVAMSWPPLDIEHKPEPPVLERRSVEISRSLVERTLSVVKFKVPHVLLCMQGPWPVNLFYFFSHSRRHVPSLVPIVVLHSNKPTTGDWGCVGMFEEVYFVQGSPLYELDLIRAGVLQAVKVVILTSRGQVDEPGEVANDMDQKTTSASTSTQDVNNIIIVATVERLLKPVGQRIIVELQQEAAFQYLRPKLFIDQRQFFSKLYQRNRVGTFQFAPPFIKGKTFCPQTLAFLMYASFFNRSTVSIVEQLVSGGRVLQDDCNGRQVRVLDQIEVPKPYVSKTFGELLTGLLRRDGLLSLGLYRPQGTRGSIVPFVFTNPSPQEPLELKDLVYILR